MLRCHHVIPVFAALLIACAHSGAALGQQQRSRDISKANHASQQTAASVSGPDSHNLFLRGSIDAQKDGCDAQNPQLDCFEYTLIPSDLIHAANEKKQLDSLLQNRRNSKLVRSPFVEGRTTSEMMTLSQALDLAYQNNPELNQERANVRARDEEVPKAWSGLRPKLSANANALAQTTKLYTGTRADPNTGVRTYLEDGYFGRPRGASVTMSQPIFDGFRTRNAIDQAESSIYAARAGLRALEQDVFMRAISAYADVLRDDAVVSIRKTNIRVLLEQKRETQIRFKEGDVTLTDMAQSEASVAQAYSDLYLAEANLKASAAGFEQVVGVAPGRLAPIGNAEKAIPRNVDEAVSIANAENPKIVSALHTADAAASNVHVAESALLPNLSFGAQASQQYDTLSGIPGTKYFFAQAGLQLNVPIYQGGGEYASIRQAKEQKGQAQFGVDVQRLAAKNAVSSVYARLRATRAAIRSGREVVRAAQTALDTVRIEALAGQRTVYDVLNADQALLEAQVKLFSYEHDHVVATYLALATIGRLSRDELKLESPAYDPSVHFEQVRNKWIGWSTPSSED